MNETDLTQSIEPQDPGAKAAIDSLEATQPWGNSTALEDLVYGAAYRAARNLVELGTASTENARLKTEAADLVSRVEVLSEQAKKDPLTGLLNRRSLLESYTKLQDAHAGTDRRKPSIDRQAYMLVTDLDNFSDVNTKGGHPAGDRVLVEVAQVLRSNVRERDVAARWGGDEFVVLLPGISRERADEVANLICDSIRSQGSITVSIGIGLVDYSKGLDSNVKTADEALYVAKRSGRDIVVHYDRTGQAETSS